MTTLPNDVQHRIDKHLDAIDSALAVTGMIRSERAAILDDVQGQIVEMLAARASNSPQAADVEAVLAELDAPEAYAQTREIPGRTVTAVQPIVPPRLIVLNALGLAVLGIVAARDHRILAILAIVLEVFLLCFILYRLRTRGRL